MHDIVTTFLIVVLRALRTILVAGACLVIIMLVILEVTNQLLSACCDM
jgi:hypothetical protein